MSGVSRFVHFLVCALAASTGCVAEAETGDGTDELELLAEGSSDMDSEPVGEAASALYHLGANQYNLPVRGGTAGSAYSLACGPNGILAGFAGLTGLTVGRLQAKCSHLQLTATTSPGVTPTTPVLYGTAVGSAGTVAFNKSCPAGQVAVGLQGRADSTTLHQLTLQCARFSQVRTPGRTVTTVPLGGGSGGIAFLDTCATNYVLTSVTVFAGGRVNRIRGVCTELLP